MAKMHVAYCDTNINNVIYICKLLLYTNGIYKSIHTLHL